MPSFRRSAAALASVLLAACGASPTADRFLGVVTPYKIEVVQGNVVTREQAEQIKVGMSRAQVRDILGSPLLADIFHADRWDYVFTIRRPGAPPQSRRVTVRFEGDRLASIEAPALPAEREFIAAIDTEKKRRSGTAPLSLTDAQMKQLPAPSQAGASPGPPIVPAARRYPPLEAP